MIDVHVSLHVLGGTQIWIGRGCAAGCFNIPMSGVIFPEKGTVPISRDFSEDRNPFFAILPQKHAEVLKTFLDSLCDPWKILKIRYIARNLLMRNGTQG